MIFSGTLRPPSEPRLVLRPMRTDLLHSKTSAITLAPYPRARFTKSLRVLRYILVASKITHFPSPIALRIWSLAMQKAGYDTVWSWEPRSEEHTSELQSLR